MTGNDTQPHVRPVNVDVLELERPATELYVCALLRQDDDGFAIKRLGITLYHSSEITEDSASGPKSTPMALPVAFLSQFDGGTAADDSLCCPTSAAMVLRFWGITVDVAEFARRSYDRRHRIYGNWALTAAALSSFGMTAWVQKHASLAELDQTLQAGRPTIVSISFAAGELPGAPIPQTNGHLVVVRGYDQFGNVLVCDPAGRTPSAGAVTYDRRKFARAWLEHGGIAIHAVPEESAR